jgi:serine/threonine protein kinase
VKTLSNNKYIQSITIIYIVADYIKMKRFKRLIPLVSPYLNGTSEPVPSDFDQLDSLGGGAFAMVYKVRNRNTKEIYALKAIKKDTILQNKKVDSVKRELEIMYQLNHENVIRLYGHYEDEDHINLLLEYIPGGNLYDLIKKNERLSEQDAIYYMRQVVAAITYLHSQPTPVLHRDIKPENILLDGNRKVKLGDFGSANSVTSDKKRYTFEGTKIYMAVPNNNIEARNLLELRL